MMYHPPYRKSADKPPQPIPGCELDFVERWRGASNRMVAARDPWKWDEHGLPAATATRKDKYPSKAELDAMTPWQRTRAQIKANEERGGGGAADCGGGNNPPGTPPPLPRARTPRKLLRHFPDIDEDQLRRLDSYCGRSFERSVRQVGGTHPHSPTSPRGSPARQF